MNMYFKSILKAIPEIHGNLKKVSIAQYKDTASLVLTCHGGWKILKAFPIIKTLFMQEQKTWYIQ